MPCSSLLPLCPIFARILAYPGPTLSPSSITPLRPGANGSVIPIPLAQRRRPLATGKEDRARPILFPVASASGRRYTGGGGRGPGEAFGANVDSFHILPGRPWGASRKMPRSLCRAQGLSERQRVQTRSELRYGLLQAHWRKGGLPHSFSK